MTREETLIALEAMLSFGYSEAEKRIIKEAIRLLKND